MVGTVFVLIGAWRSIEERMAEYLAAFLILEGLMIDVFCGRLLDVCSIGVP